MRIAYMVSNLAFFALLCSTGVYAFIDPHISELMIKKLTAYGKFNETQIYNAQLILSRSGMYSNDMRHHAYILSTAIGESNIMPTKEKKAEPGTPEYEKQKNRYYNYYKSRGYVPFKGQEIYRKFGNMMGQDLLDEPKLALDDDIAAWILSIGMHKGLFTGRKLSEFINRIDEDWLNARRAINRLDKAAEYAERAKAIFEQSISDD